MADDTMIKEVQADIQKQWANYQNKEPAIESPAWYADPVNYLQVGGALTRAGIRGATNYAAAGLKNLGISEGVTQPTAGLLSKLPSGEIKDVANLTSWLGDKIGIGGKGFVNKALDTAAKNPITTFVAAANAPQNFETNPAQAVVPPVTEKPPVAQPIPPASVGTGLPTSAVAATPPVEEFPPSWATKNGWNISNSGKTNAKGIGITPMGEQPTAVRISEKDRTGKGMMASAKLATDNADTTLVSNPTFNKGIVDPNGYAHVDDRQYLEKANPYKGQKVPLLQAIGIPKKESEDRTDREISAIKNNPENWSKITGGILPKAQKEITELLTNRTTADAHVAAVKEGKAGDDVYKLLHLQQGAVTIDQKRAADVADRFKVLQPDEKTIHPALTFLNVAENMAPSGDYSKLPADLRPGVQKAMEDFEKENQRWQSNPINKKFSKKDIRNQAYADWKDKLKKAAGMQ